MGVLDYFIWIQVCLEIKLRIQKVILDSFTLALADEIENLVVPELRNEYETEKFYWFLRDDSPEEKRFPGKMKVEAETTSGFFCGLSPKCYVISDGDEKRKFEDKMALKGVSKKLKIDSMSFVETLYNPENEKSVSCDQFAFKKNTTCMYTIQMQKKLMNCFYTKMQVQRDHVTLCPLSVDNKLI